MVKAKSSAESSRYSGHSVATTTAAAPAKAVRASAAIVSLPSNSAGNVRTAGS